MTSLRSLLALFVVTLLSGACLAPVSLGSPDRSRTVGQGNVGLVGRVEMPSINLISGGSDEDLRDEGLLAPVLGGEASVGVHERVDIEAGVEMPLFFYILPIPNGIWAGVRTGVVATEQVELAVSGRFGGLLLGEVEGDVETDESATARFGAIGFSVSAATGTAIRPGLALRYTRYSVSTEGVDDAAANFGASVASVDLYLEARLGGAEILPFINIASFDSPNLDSGRATLVGAGLALRITPGDANRP